MVLFRALGLWWRARQRKIDIETIWPELVDQARDEWHAKQGMAMHIAMDPAWADLNQDEKIKFLRQLPWPAPKI